MPEVASAPIHTPDITPDIVIAGFARSPFHLAGKGALARTRPDDLAAQVVRALIARSGLDAALIEDLDGA